MAETRGGSRPGAGRKKGGHNAQKMQTGYNTGRLVISCLEADAQAIRQQAAACGKSVSRYLIDLALQDIASSNSLTLS